MIEDVQAAAIGTSTKPLVIAPSILTADLANLEAAIRAVEAGGADRIHLDVMDGHFVPNITIGPAVVAALRKISNLPFDVHLMIRPPEPYIKAFIDAGADRVIVHLEATDHLHRLIQLIKSSGAAAGVCLNPATPIIDLEEIAPYIDLVLVMSVNPGFGGQRFIETSYRKIFRAKRLIHRWNPAASIGVDGGVDVGDIARVVEAGADYVVTGSSVFNAQASPADNIAALRVAARAVQET